MFQALPRMSEWQWELTHIDCLLFLSLHFPGIVYDVLCWWIAQQGEISPPTHTMLFFAFAWHGEKNEEEEEYFITHHLLCWWSSPLEPLLFLLLILHFKGREGWWEKSLHQLWALLALCAVKRGKKLKRQASTHTKMALFYGAFEAKERALGSLGGSLHSTYYAGLKCSQTNDKAAGLNNFCSIKRRRHGFLAAEL